MNKGIDAQPVDPYEKYRENPHAITDYLIELYERGDVEYANDPENGPQVIPVSKVIDMIMETLRKGESPELLWAAHINGALDVVMEGLPKNEGKRKKVIDKNFNKFKEWKRQDAKKSKEELPKKIEVKSEDQAPIETDVNDKKYIIDTSSGAIEVPEGVKSLEDLVNHLRTVDRVEYPGGAVTGEDLAERIINSANNKNPESIVRKIEGLPSLLDRLKKGSSKKIEVRSEKDESGKETQQDALDVSGVEFKNFSGVLKKIRLEKSSYANANGDEVKSSDVARLVAETIYDRRHGSGVKIPKELDGIGNVEAVIDKYSSDEYDEDFLRNEVYKYKNWVADREDHKGEDEKPDKTEAKKEAIKSKKEHKEYGSKIEGKASLDEDDRRMEAWEARQAEAAKAGEDADQKDEKSDEQKIEAAREGLGMPVNNGVSTLDVSGDNFDPETEIATARAQLQNYRQAFTHAKTIEDPDRRHDKRLELSEQVGLIEKDLRSSDLRARAEAATGIEKERFNALADEASRVVDQDWLDKTHDKYVVEKKEETESSSEETPKSGLLNNVAEVFGHVASDSDEAVPEPEPTKNAWEGVRDLNKDEQKEQVKRELFGDEEKAEFTLSPGERVRSTADPSKEGAIKEIKDLSGETYVELEDGTLIPYDFVERVSLQDVPADLNEEEHDDVVTPDEESKEMPPNSVEEMMKDPDFLEFLGGDLDGSVGEVFDAMFGEMNDADKGQMKKNIQEVLVENPELAGVIHERFGFYSNTLKERDELEARVTEMTGLWQERQDIKTLVRKLDNDPIGFYGIRSVAHSLVGADASYLDKAADVRDQLNVSYLRPSFRIPFTKWLYKTYQEKAMERVSEIETQVRTMQDSGKTFERRGEIVDSITETESYLKEMVDSLRTVTEIIKEETKQHAIDLLKGNPKTVEEVEENLKILSEVDPDEMSDKEKDRHMKENRKALAAIAKIEFEKNISKDRNKTLYQTEIKLLPVLKLAGADKATRDEVIKILSDMAKKERGEATDLENKDGVKKVPRWFMIEHILLKFKQNRYAK